MTAAEDIEVRPTIKAWLSANGSKIQKIWYYADWRMWARFDLYAALETALDGKALVNHSTEEFWDNKTKEDIDLRLESRNNEGPGVGVYIRTERVDENAGSYEKFMKQYEEDWEKLVKLGPGAGDYEGFKVILLGLSNEPSEEDEVEKPSVEQEQFTAGGVLVTVREIKPPSFH